MTESLAIIRNRYQLTIPASLRKFINWLTPQKVIKVKLVSGEKVLIEPYSEKSVDWDEIWKSFAAASKIARKTSLSNFVIQDRSRH